jgi:S1-C subfamily serine protease
MSFDTEGAGCSVATGFVVDAKQGLILTNRHVVHQGPVTAEAVFQNNEEVPCYQLYSDPIHDFGLFKFDPTQVRHLEIGELALVPEGAVVGTEIRIVGNDAAEKLSIASGTLARVDREAPNYGRGTFNDFNTFYLQASSATTGGSSGSPVINSDGDVIALNAGGKMGTAAAFYLPLQRVKRAVDLLRAGRSVSRGYIGCSFKHTPLSESRRLGLRRETEDEVWQRSSQEDSAGLLVVDQVMPGSVADGIIEPGDIMTKIVPAGIEATQADFADFISFEDLLDNSVGRSVTVHVERRGTPMQFTVEVADLHTLAPKRCLCVGGAVIQPLSLQFAYSFSLECGRPCIADPGYMFEAHMRRNAVILEMDGKPTKTLEDVEQFFKECSDEQDVLVKFHQMGEPTVLHQTVITVPKSAWFGMVRRESSQPSPSQRLKWDKVPIRPTGSDSIPSTDVGGNAADPVNNMQISTQLRGRTPVEQMLAPSLVTVDFTRPFSINGIRSSRYRGTGLIVDADLGLICVDRNTIPSGLGDVAITFADTQTVNGKVVYVHPWHNFAFVQYNSSSVRVDAKSAKLCPTPASPGDDVVVVGLSSRLEQGSSAEIVSRETKIKAQEWQKLGLPHPPRFQQQNLEILRLMDTIKTDGGVLVRPDGEVQALWSSFFYQRVAGGRAMEGQFVGGLPINLIAEATEQLQVALQSGGTIPPLQTLAVDFETISLAQARKRGLSDSWTRQFAEKHQHSLLAVSRCWGGSPAQSLLQNGDVLLRVDGQQVKTMREVEKVTCRVSHNGDPVSMTVLRNRKVKEAVVPTISLSCGGQNGLNEDRLIFFMGLLLQKPPLAIATQRGLPAEGVYVAARYPGSPASVSGPPPTSRIMEVDGQPTPDLTTFLRVVNSLTSRKDSCVIKFRELSGATRVTSMKLEREHWGTSEIRADEQQEWTRIDHSSGSA